MRVFAFATGFAAIVQAPAVRAQYTLSDRYDSSNFFSTFDFFNEEDPTHGFVEYVDATTAKSQGLVAYVDNAIYMGVDYKTQNPQNGR
ncbi:hypothetical protein FOVSG1_015401 [Fusarium oxysporum f. sp. vasinfectum]